MNVSFAKFGAFQLMGRLLGLVFGKEKGGEQIFRTQKSEHGSKIIYTQVTLHHDIYYHKYGEKRRQRVANFVT